MKLRFKKTDTIIVVLLIVASGLFLYKAGYIEPTFIPDDTPPDDPVNDTAPPPGPTPPTSFTPSYRREVSPEDEGVHFDRIRICREWWYYTAVFDDPKSDLFGWTVQISFNHMARGDLLGTTKPDVLVVTLCGPDGETYGGMINKKRGLGILTSGTLIANSPGVNVEFEESWAEGEYPNWHVHAEDLDIDKSHTIIIDFDYTASALPIWTIGNRAFDKSESTIANYLFTGLECSGTVSIDNQEYFVKGTGHHEHSWTPNLVTKGSLNGWDWFHISLENGWHLYSSTYYPTPQLLSTKTPKINPLSTLILTMDDGETLIELKNVDVKITKEDEKIFPFVKMPSAFDITAKPSLNPLYVISQSFLYGSNMVVEAELQIEEETNKVWKFPTYLGMKTGRCSLSGTFTWSDDDGEHQIDLSGIGSSWSMRALL